MFSLPSFHRIVWSVAIVMALVVLLLARFPHIILRNEASSGATITGNPSHMVNPSQDAVSFNDAGVAAIDQGEYEAAEESFLTALKINPSYAEAWNNLCALRLSKKAFTDAVDACTEAIEVSPDFADAHYNLALALFQNGSFAEAEKEALLAKQFGRNQESDDLLVIIRQKQH